MKIGILGSGAVGQALARGFSQEGHEVLIGTRNPSKPDLEKISNAESYVNTGSFADTAAFGELIVLAVQGLVVEEVLNLAGKNNFRGKTVIDTTNPIAAAPPVNGVLPYFTSLENSLLEKTQQSIPEAMLVKAFNSVGNNQMYKPDFKGIRPSMFICGRDAAAKKTVTDILSAFGWDAEDMGGVEAARAIEPLCMLWCIPGFLHNQWNHAFKLLKA
jgi:predicted dinucleotide-binding enzyme